MAHNLHSGFEGVYCEPVRKNEDWTGLLRYHRALGRYVAQTGLLHQGVFSTLHQELTDKMKTILQEKMQVAKLFRDRELSAYKIDSANTAH